MVPSPVLIRALALLPKIKAIMPKISSVLNLSGNPDQVEMGKTMKELSQDIPDDSTLAAIIRRADVFNSTNRDHLIVPVSTNRTLGELLAAFNYVMISAVFGADAAEAYIRTMPTTSHSSFLQRNREKLMSVTFDGFCVALCVFNNQVKPKDVNMKMTVAFLALSQITNAQVKLDVAKSETRMLRPDRMLKGVNDPNYFFSGRTKEEKQNDGYFAMFLDTFDWLEEKFSNLLTGASSIVANEDVSNSVNFVSLDGTANDYCFNPGNDEDLLTTLDYIFFSVLKIKLD